MRIVMLVAATAVAVGCSPSPCDDGSIKCTVLEYKHTVYAEWGKSDSGERFEDRFSGVKVRLEYDGRVETAWLVQPWWPNPRWSTRPRVKYPEVGETFYLKSLPEKSKVLPIDEPSYWYAELDRIE
jgi:hypothetical protein